MTMNTSLGTLFRIISYFFLWFEVINASISYGRLVHKAEDFDDRLLTLDAKWTHEVTSLINCVAICSLDERCVSVQFNEAATICTGYVVSSASGPDSISSPGYVMFDMERSSQTFGSSCSDDSECTFTRHTSCVAGSCKCSTSRTGDECEGVDTTQTATTSAAAQTTTTATLITTAATPTAATATPTTATATPTTATATPTTATTTPSTATATPSTATATQTTATATQTTAIATPTTATATQTTATTTQTTAH
ncbi:integumentary mucin C.1-like [Haliotis rubra]|uniref:integumentary mucin C.1-like n=1 Tax=Haliotis rubra TaxID=36100 RepID=UPI001EE50043|nr:integumentary mucin C.1-like [Haliotis rubra]